MLFLHQVSLTRVLQKHYRVVIFYFILFILMNTILVKFQIIFIKIFYFIIYILFIFVVEDNVE